MTSQTVRIDGMAFDLKDQKIVEVKKEAKF